MKQESRPIDWTITLFILGYHLLVFTVVPVYLMHYSVSWKLWVISFALLYAAGMSVTAGYHRLYSHSTYKTNKIVEAFFLFFASIATQGSALRWSYDHRIHHAFVDTDKDPYSIKKGFWFAHILWLFRKTGSIEKKVVADLYKNRLVQFQHNNYALCMLGSNLVMTLFIGWALGDFLGAFVISWLVRMFFLHHFTWFINSLAHTWGTQSFSREHSAMDCYTVCLLTFGEGYHNYHHSFANDYRNGIKWYHFDPTKWLIWTLYKCKLASHLKRTNPTLIGEKVLLERKEEVLQKLKNFWSDNKVNLEASVEKGSSEILATLKKIQSVSSEYAAYKKKTLENAQLADRQLVTSMKKEMDSLRKDLKGKWKNWRQLSKTIHKLKPSLAEK